MNDRKEYKVNDLQRFKVSITDFIFQEIFRFAMYKMASSEVKKIKIIYSKLKKNLEKFDSIYGYKHIDELASLATDLIVQGCNDSHFTKDIKKCISNRYYAEQEFEWLIDKSGTQQQQQDRIGIYKQTFSDIQSVYNEYLNEVWTISTRYPPHLLASEQDYELILKYIVKKEYLTKIVTSMEDDIFSENKENPPKVKSTTLTPPLEPYELINAKRRNIINFDYIFDEFQIPEKAISKKLNSKKLRKKKLTKSHISNMIELSFFNKEHDPQICNSICINVDLSSPIDDRELVQALTLIRNEIRSVQNNNRAGKMLLAMTLDELDEAANMKRLEYLDYMKLMEIFSTKPQDEFAFNELKLIVSGLILYRARWIDEGIKTNLLNTKLILSEQLTNKFRIGFSEKNIDRGYILVKRLVKNQLKEMELEQQF